MQWESCHITFCTCSLPQSQSFLRLCSQHVTHFVFPQAPHPWLLQNTNTRYVLRTEFPFLHGGALTGASHDVGSTKRKWTQRKLGQFHSSFYKVLVLTPVLPMNTPVQIYPSVSQLLSFVFSRLMLLEKQMLFKHLSCTASQSSEKNKILKRL